MVKKVNNIVPKKSCRQGEIGLIRLGALDLILIFSGGALIF